MHKISYVLRNVKSVQIPGALVNKFCTVAYDICGCSEWNMIRATLRSTWGFKMAPKFKKKKSTHPGVCVITVTIKKSQ